MPKKNILNDFKDKKTSELFKLLNSKLSELRSLSFLQKKNTKEFKELKLYIANLNNYIYNK